MKKWNPVYINPSEPGRYWCYVEYYTDIGISHYQWNCSWNGKEWNIEHPVTGRDNVTHWIPLHDVPEFNL